MYRAADGAPDGAAESDEDVAVPPLGDGGDDDDDDSPLLLDEHAADDAGGLDITMMDRGRMLTLLDAAARDGGSDVSSDDE